MSTNRLDAFDEFYYESDDDGDVYDPTTFLSELQEDIVATSNSLLDTLGFPQTFGWYASKEIDSHYHVVESNVGDDANVTTDSFCYGLLTLCTAVHVSGIKLSLKDIGLSKMVANYAEGWLLTPVSAGSSFEAVNRFNKGRGLAFTLDPVKLKLLSAVRKQSSEELSLESKLKHLAEIAAWTDHSWFTYDFHQMALLLANCVFDFNDAYTFPFLYKTEGGCGGLPPYGNLSTAYSALHYYARGRSKRAILGVMQETVAIAHDRLSPKDTFFLRSSHLANAGDSTWAHYESAYRSLLKENGLSRGQTRDILQSLKGTELDRSILDLGYELSPEKFTVGSAISHLRAKGLLMTEIDVKLLEQKLKREKAVFGTKPIGELLVELEEEAKLFKSSAWKILSELYGGSDAIRIEVDGKLGYIGQTFEAFSEVAEAYYRIRSDLNAEFTSFFYTDFIRVFKTSDVENHFGMKDPGLMQDFGLSELIPKPRLPTEETRHGKRATQLIQEWLESGDLNTLLNRPLPTDLGADDSRILNDLLDEPVDNSTTGYVAVIITDDSGLVRTAAAMLKDKPWHPGQTVIVAQIRRNDYQAICLQGVKEAYELKLRPYNKPPRLYAVRYYNYILRKEWFLPHPTVESIRNTIPGTWRKSVRISISYDVPNIERGLERTVYRSDTNTIIVFGGGCLERLTVDTLPWGRSWAEIPIPEIAGWEDFSSMRRRTIFANNIRIRSAIPVAKPEYVAPTRGIHHWLESMIQA